jgi:hypothetical protein
LKVSQDVSNTSITPSTFRSEATDTFAREVHHYVRDYIQLADQKAGLIFATLSALSILAYNLGLYNSHGLLCWLKPLEKWRFTELTAFLAILSTSCSAISALVVIIPRRDSVRGIGFWDSVVKFQSSADYAHKVVSTEPAMLTRALLEDAYELATVCRRKYLALGGAIWAGAVGTVATILFLLSR